MLFPIVRLASPRSPNEWRGTLVPADRDAWFASYAEVLGDLAALGTMTGVSRLAIGSELSSLDGDTTAICERWRRLLERIRAVYPGVLVYSANWDHYQDAPLLDLVDEAGVVAYFELRSKNGPSDVPALERRWRELRAEIAALAGRPQAALPVHRGGLPIARGRHRVALGRDRRRRHPTWTSSAGPSRPFATSGRLPPRRAGAVGDAAPMGFAGLYVWNWYGFGGPDTVSYTPRGKPAAAEVKALMEGL